MNLINSDIESNRDMRYLSFFTGIGGFEVAIHQKHPHAQCLGYSEIAPAAIRVYERHFPTHQNMGDITKITRSEIQKRVKSAGGCDLVVGGFPCQNLSSLSRMGKDDRGLQGKKSSVFYVFLRVLEQIVRVAPEVDILLENNASMSAKHREKITQLLQKIFPKKVYVTMINNADIGVQQRRRLYWTTYPITQMPTCIQTWKHVLEPLHRIDPSTLASARMIRYMNGDTGMEKSALYRSQRVQYHRDTKTWRFVTQRSLTSTRWDLQMHSDTCTKKTMLEKPYPCGKAKTITTRDVQSKCLLDRRGCQEGHFVIRRMTIRELCKLFHLPGDYLDGTQYWKQATLLGNTVCVAVINFLLQVR